jgi:hypothetical protein
MDVHAPHEPVHTWRDFFTHLTIVTIGLFIALSLEGLVEYVHHRHLVRDARENIRHELESDHEAAQKDLVLLQKDIDTQKANVQIIHRLSSHPKDFHGSVQNTLSLYALSDAAWRTARDSGALGYMPYDEVQRYSEIYMREDLFTKKAISAGEQDFEAASSFNMGYAPESLPDDEYPRLLRENASVQVAFTILKGFVQEFDASCVRELKQ